MSEPFPLVMTFPDRNGGYPKPGGAFHLVGADAFLRTSHEAFANLKTFHSYRLTPLPGDVIQATPVERVALFASGEHVENFSMRYPQQRGLLQQAIGNPVSEVAEVIEHCLLGRAQSFDGLSYCIASVIVERFAAGHGAATIAQTLLDEFPGTFHSRRAANLVEKAIEAIQTVRPGWKRLVPAPDDENSPFSAKPTPPSADTRAEEEVPMETGVPGEPEAENSGIDVSPDSSVDDSATHIPVKRLFSDPDGASLNEAGVRRPPVDFNPRDDGSVDIDLVGPGASAANTEHSSEPTHVSGGRSAMRLLERPNLRRFVPAA